MTSLHAFVCYRRHDSFMPDSDEKDSTVVFLGRLEHALGKLGFSSVFVDKSRKYGMQNAQNYESRAFKAIEECDLFIALIGSQWNTLVVSRKGRDAPSREIRAALNYEKTIFPLLVDQGTMPAPEVLAKQIRRFHYLAGDRIDSVASVGEIAQVLSDVVDNVARMHRIKAIWTGTYAFASVLAYYFCAIHPNIVGLREYGPEAWMAMARMWGGLFIWPIPFLPFCLFALFRPFTTIVESIIRANSFRSTITYLAPVILATLFTLAGWSGEVLDPHQVPWTLTPRMTDSVCKSTDNAVSPAKHQITSVAHDLSDIEPLSSYDSDQNLRKKYEKAGDIPFWLENKCWPNVLFFLTIPYFDDVSSIDYLNERNAIQPFFDSILQDKRRVRLHVRLSDTSTAYRISFAILAWLGLTGIVLAGFFMAVKIKDPQSDQVRILPVDDAFMCLTYSLVTLMTWIPFRINTEYIKYLYACRDDVTCRIDVTRYMPDIFLACMLFCGYAFATVGLLAQFKRVALALFGFLMMLGCALLSISVYAFRSDVARLTEYWQFYVLLSIPVVSVVFVLWLLFNPTEVHFRDFRKDLY